MRVAGIDFGLVRVGLAVSDELGLLAHPRPHLDGRNRTRLLDTLSALCRDEGVDCFVVGLPRHLDGREGRSAKRVRQFARTLARAAGVRVVLVDEWLTTRQAGDRLREQGLDARAARSRIDSAAAAIVLQSYLDRERAREDGATGGETD